MLMCLILVIPAGAVVSDTPAKLGELMKREVSSLTDRLDLSVVCTDIDPASFTQMEARYGKN